MTALHTERLDGAVRAARAAGELDAPQLGRASGEQVRGSCGPEGVHGNNFPEVADTGLDAGALDAAQLGRAGRMAVRLERDGGTCLWCGRAFGRLVPPTRDHLVPRVKGGPSWLENEAAACRRCNAERGHQSPAEWAGECERRGWPVDRARLVGTLRSLDAAIAVRGGQRRARHYLASQLRRLARA